MSEKSHNDDNVDNDDNADLLKGKREKISSCASSYSIEVCQGADCTGVGGRVVVLEIEELVREHHYQNRDGRIRVVAGGCRDFCSVGPNVHIHVHQQQRNKTKSFLLESFQNVREASSCDRVVNSTIAYASSSEEPSDTGTTNETQPASSSKDRHRSMMARRAERKRWEALKDVSRTIAKCNKVVAAAATASNVTDSGIERKLRIWKESCKDRIEGAEISTRSMGQSQREHRRVEYLVEIASEKLDRICLQNDDESDSSCDESDTSEK